MLSVGIDLGTTYSCIGIYRNGTVEIVPNKFGNRTTPSYIEYLKDSIEIGENAKKNCHSKNVVYNVKRVIGRNNSDIKTDFPVIKNGKITIGKKKFTPEEISAQVLKYLLKLAENYTNVKITEAVITVPAYFSNTQRNATKKAGELAGIKVSRIINEPTAASLCYGITKKTQNQSTLVLVFDFGGGTLDISVLSMNYPKNIFQVLSTKGDSNLGGEDINENLNLFLKKQLKGKFNLKDIEELKKQLSFQDQVIFETETETTVITRKIFNHVNKHIFDTCLKKIKEALLDAKVRKEEIDQIILVGGSTRIPKITEMLETFFDKKVSKEINPDEAVAFGATLQAAIINGQLNSDLILMDVCPLSLGIETAGGVMSNLIFRNTGIPCSITKVFSTFYDNQENVKILIFEGERTRTQYNILLGTITLKGINLAPKGIPRIEVTFSIDINGILQVLATEKGSNKTEIITIEIGENNLITEEEINKNILESEKLKADDIIWKEKTIYSNKLASLLDDISKYPEYKNTCEIDFVSNAVNPKETYYKLTAEFEKFLASKEINISDLISDSESET